VKTLFGTSVIDLFAVMDIPFHTDDRFDARRLHLLVKIDGAEHIAMVGHRDRGHAEFFDTLDQIGDLVGSVKQGVFCMQMQVGEGLYAHGVPVKKSSRLVKDIIIFRG